MNPEKLDVSQIQISIVLKHNIYLSIKTKSQHPEERKKGVLREKVEDPSSWSSWVSYLHRPASVETALTLKKTET
jgi:hypothetical protein